MRVRDRLRAAETRWLRRFSASERDRPLWWAMLVATRLGDGWGLGVIIPAALIVGGRNRGVACVGLGTASAITVAIVVQTIKAIVRRRRPTGLDLAAPISAPDKHAFPSGHAAQSFGMVVILSWVSPWLGAGMLAIAVWIGLSRMFFGLHYPTDVIAGAILGVGVTLLVVWTARHVGYTDWLMHLRPAA